MQIWEYEANETDRLATQVEKDNTIVMTKPEMAIDLLKLINILPTDVVMEPCRGHGAFYNNFPQCEKLWCEINEGVDYLEFSGEVDYTISNPPFVPRKLFWSFQEKAMETTRKGIYWLINMSSMNVFTQKRVRVMAEKGWYVQNMHIVSDKRWFGRYVWVKITKDKSDFITFGGNY